MLKSNVVARKGKMELFSLELHSGIPICIASVAAEEGT
jgi:hypothetical protein